MGNKEEIQTGEQVWRGHFEIGVSWGVGLGGFWVGGLEVGVVWDAVRRRGRRE